MMDRIIHNKVTERRHNSIAVGVPLLTIQLPIFLQVTLLLLTVMTAICVCWTELVRQQKPPANPFSDYRNILPGQPLRHVIEQGFQCTPDNLAGQRNYCILSPADGPFWYIHLVTTKGFVTSVSFCSREGAIKVGDLAMLWGKPTIQLFEQSGLFRWARPNSSAYGLSVNHGFSYTFPLEHITITTRSQSSQNPSTDDYSGTNFKRIFRNSPIMIVQLQGVRRYSSLDIWTVLA